MALLHLVIQNQVLIPTWPENKQVNGAKQISTSRHFCSYPQNTAQQVGKTGRDTEEVQLLRWTNLLNEETHIDSLILIIHKPLGITCPPFTYQKYLIWTLQLMLSFKGIKNLGSKSLCLRSEKPKPAKFLENVSSTTKKSSSGKCCPSSVEIVSQNKRKGKIHWTENSWLLVS